MALTNHIVPDSPTNNFATLANQLQHDATSSAVSDGNLKFLEPSDSSLEHSEMSNAIANFSATSGKKWYWEVVIFNTTDSNQRVASSIGVILQQNDTQGNVMYSTDFFNGTCYAWGNDTNNTNSTSSTGVFQRNGSTRNQVSSAQTSYLIHGTVVGVLLDLESSPNTVTLYANGSELPDRGGITTKMNLAASTQFFPIFGCGTTTGTQTHLVNFGQNPTFGGAKSPTTTYTDANGIGAFYYQPPTDALALCTANLPDFTPDVTGDVPQNYFKTVLYSGQSANQSITDVGFQSDLVWIKSKTGSAQHHRLFDSLRKGTKTYHAIYSSINWSERYAADSSEIKNFTATGFDLVGYDDAGSSWAGTNLSDSTYVAWCWKAGGAPTADNSNTSGAMTANSVSRNGTLQSNYTPAGSPTIYPTRMSINTDAGFSIFKVTKSAAQYSYDTYPHGLSKAPDFIISKSLDSTDNWYCFHRSITPNNNYSARIQLNQTTQATLNSSMWGTPTNITDNIVAWDGPQSVENIFYCWHSVEGYSKFGSYTGNGSADGPFVYCGFRPAFVMIKRTDAAGSWEIQDSERAESNPVNKYLYANVANAEATYPNTDFLSNGFKLRDNTTGNNVSSSTYIYMAFAEQPFKFSNAR